MALMDLRNYKKMGFLREITSSSVTSKTPTYFISLLSLNFLFPGTKIYD